MAKEKIDFEKDLERLDTIVKSMERETLPLAESLSLFDEGMAIVKRLESALAEAETKINTILAAKNVDKVNN